LCIDVDRGGAAQEFKWEYMKKENYSSQIRELTKMSENRNADGLDRFLFRNGESITADYLMSVMLSRSFREVRKSSKGGRDNFVSRERVIY